ncbi:hypothetical protein GWI33_020954 [Rhynchophorus ferrugineus]|uniref:Uncharacterized protein n=1 Tax=Rhynchophorus ferrugineus TaxID=354439 RepID=A0A834M5A6_RHYFE|nr:hypothetical protein GWI33_020954 [Rhynchophorus ferrugineus]
MISYNKILVMLNTRSLVANDFSTKSGKVLGKLMGINKNKKKFYPNKAPLLPSNGLFDRVPLENKIVGNPKRISILNKMFMRNVTDLMTTGEYATQFYGHGIQVNKVKITPDYKILKVYWIANESSNDDVVENLLKKSAGTLRHELSQLRVMGHIPNIVFIKDKGYFNIIKVEQKLAVADYGEDYIKSDLVNELKSEHELWTVLDADFKKKIEAFDSASGENNLNESDILPVMPQNVLGLDHMDILKRIKKNKSKSEAEHRKSMKDQSTDDDHTMKSYSAEYTSHAEHRDAFKQFLHSRQILRQKQKKIEKNWSPDTQILQEESMEQYFKQMELYDNDPMEEDDYIEEIDDDPRRNGIE